MDVFRSTRYAPREKKTNGEAASEANGSSIPLNGLTSSPAASVSGDHDIEATTAAPSVVVEEEEEEVPQMSVPMTIGLLAVVTVVSLCVYPVCGGLSPDADRTSSLTSAPCPQCVAVTAEFLVDSINGIVSTGNINREFIGLILLPIVGNAAGACVARRLPATASAARLCSSARADPALSRTSRARHGRHGLRQGQAHAQSWRCCRLQHCTSRPLAPSAPIDDGTDLLPLLRHGSCSKSRSSSFRSLSPWRGSWGSR